MTYKKNSTAPCGESLSRDRKREGETVSQDRVQKVIKRAQHSFYLDTAIIRSLDQAYRQTYHELYPTAISKSDFLEECIRYALSSLQEIKSNLTRGE